MTPTALWPYPKTQIVRLADVFLIGPLMIYGGVALAKKQPLAGWLLAGLGVTTIHYNGLNYLRVQKEEAP